MKIIIATGGSGGHVFPALHVADKLKEDGNDICFMGSFGHTKTKIFDRGYSFIDIQAAGFSSRSFKSFFKSVFFMIRAMKESSRFLKAEKPDVVAGFGGYGAFPVVLMAAFMAVSTASAPVFIGSIISISHNSTSFLAKRAS